MKASFARENPGSNAFDAIWPLGHTGQVRGALAVGLVVVACGERTLPSGLAGDGGADVPAADGTRPPASEIVARSGSRLKARWSVAPDGRRVFLGWLDSQMGIACSFIRAADGVYRCFPLQLTSSLPAYEFADAGCTEAAVQVGVTVPTFQAAQCGPSSFVTRYDFTGCNLGVRAFRLGRELSDGRTFSRIAGACTPGFLSPGTTAFAIGPEVPPDTFVRATPRGAPVAAGGSVQPMVLAADDGAEQPIGWQDVAEQAACRLLRLGDDRVHCVSRSTFVSSSAFADGACTQPAVYASSCAPLPRYAELPDRACPQAYTIRSVGDRLTTYQSTIDGGCTPRSAANTPYYATGAEISPATFPVVDTSDESGERLRRRQQTSPGAPSLSTTWVDAVRDSPCRATRFGDAIRCAPLPGAGAAVVYGDSACTSTLAIFQDRCPDPYTFNIDRSACPGRVLVFAVGGRYTGAVFAQSLDRSVNPPRVTCTPYTLLDTDTVHTLTAVPETDLPALTIVVE